MKKTRKKNTSGQTLQGSNIQIIKWRENANTISFHQKLDHNIGHHFLKAFNALDLRIQQCANNFPAFSLEFFTLDSSTAGLVWRCTYCLFFYRCNRENQNSQCSLFIHLPVTFWTECFHSCPLNA